MRSVIFPLSRGEKAFISSIGLIIATFLGFQIYFTLKIKANYDEIAMRGNTPARKCLIWEEENKF